MANGKQKIHKKNRMWQVWHEDGYDYGLTPKDFPTRGEACYYRDAWNKDVPGHVVRMIDVTANN